jgi:hypothetical protein
MNYDFDNVRDSLLRRHLTRRIGWWDQKLFFSKPIRRLEPIEACGGGYVREMCLKFVSW